MCSLARTRWCMQVEVSFEVATLDVSTPLAVALDGGATVLPTSTVVDLLPKVRRPVTGHRRAVLRQRARTWQRRGAPAPQTVYTSLTESATAAQMAGTAPPGVAC
jgi:hypothetical protein